MSTTHTTEGVIPHLIVDAAGKRILAPVKLDFDREPRWMPKYQTTLRAPLRRDGKLVFALPGGGEVVA